MRNSLIRRVLSIAALTGAAACSSSEITLGGPLNVLLSTNAPISVSDSLIVDATVQGRSLLGLVITWGDDQVDSLFASGAQSAQYRVAHLYDSAAVFTIRATAVDQLEGFSTEEVTVTVNP